MKKKWQKQLKTTHNFIKKQIDAQNNLVKKVGAKDTREYETAKKNEELENKINKLAYNRCYDIAKKGLSKTERSDAFNEIKEEILGSFSEEEIEENGDLINEYFHLDQKNAIRELTLKKV